MAVFVLLADHCICSGGAFLFSNYFFRSITLLHRLHTFSQLLQHSSGPDDLNNETRCTLKFSFVSSLSYLNFLTSLLMRDVVMDFLMISVSSALRGLWLHMNRDVHCTICSQLTPTQDLGILQLCASELFWSGWLCAWLHYSTWHSTEIFLIHTRCWFTLSI